MKQLKDLVKGDKIKIDWCGGIRNVKVLNNNPKEKRIYLQIQIIPYLTKTKRIIDYDGYGLEDYELLNY